MSVGSFSTILEIFCFFLPKSGWMKWGKYFQETNLQDHRRICDPLSFLRWTTSTACIIHVAITHSTEKSPPLWRMSIDKCCASFTSHPTICGFALCYTWCRGKGHYVSKSITLLLMTSPGTPGTSQDRKTINSFFSQCFTQVFSRRWPYCKSCFPTPLLKLLCLDLCSFC